MKKHPNRFIVALKAARQLGARQVFWYALYQVRLRSGSYRKATPVGDLPEYAAPIHAPFAIPDVRRLEEILGDRLDQAVAEADEVVSGQARLFGGPPAPILLTPPDASQHWTYYESRPQSWGVEDLKLLWEPARFGWAYTLARAYRLTGDEAYPAAFWQYFDQFVQGNPTNQGPNWCSAQEVALRLLALVFAAGVFQHSPRSTPDQIAHLAQAVAAHAARIPPTLCYARAQNNNHHITEALGLYAASFALDEHPQARAWRELGWQELNLALRSQIAPDGTYAQHSLNYHRLMLHAALQALSFRQPFPPHTQARLAAAATWLLAQVDPHSGGAPNLGSNDGANILPLSGGAFGDYRPVAQAAARAFLNRPTFPPGPWDELCLWLGLPVSAPADSAETPLPRPSTPAVPWVQNGSSWAALRAAAFTSRPSHADQLHVDLWWRGENIALDAGSYRYTAPPPWDNALSATLVHNTVVVNHQDQMQRSGRFLWLDWAQAGPVETQGSPVTAIAARHTGYQRLGVTHRRILKAAGPGRWQVIDQLHHATETVDGFYKVFTFRLHWLLPDWPWEFAENTLTLTRPAGGRVRLSLNAEIVNSAYSQIDHFSLVRAGQALLGPQEVDPTLGWFSPTYNQKFPALSFSLQVQCPRPLTMYSDWVLEE